MRSDDTPLLLFAVVNQSLQVLDLLLRRRDRVPVDATEKQQRANTMLIKTAAQFGFDDIVARLLDDRRFDARTLARDDYALYRWFKQGHVQVVRLLLARVRLVEVCLALRACRFPVYVVLEIVDWLPLMSAALPRQDKIATLQRILEAKKVSAQNDNSSTRETKVARTE